MSMQSRIRDFLTAHMGEAFTPPQIADAIGAERGPVSWAINTMMRGNYLIRIPTGKRSHLFRMNPEWKPKDPLNGKQVSNHGEYKRMLRARRAAAGLPPYRSPAELKRKAEAQARAEARKAEFAERREKREAAKKARMTLSRKSKAITVVARNAAKRAPKAQHAVKSIAPAETVEQWMARTGKQPERLPRGATSWRLAA